MSTVVVKGLTLLDDLRAELDGMSRQAPAILARTLNRAGVAGKTAMVKAVRADTGLTEKAINREIAVDKANRSRLQVSFTIQGQRIPLIAFQARGPEPSRGRGKGVSYRLPTGRGRIANAFIATMPTGHRGVFKRIPGNRRGPKPNRSQLPIRELFGPSIPHVFLKFEDVFQRAAQESFESNLRHEIDFANRPKGEFPIAPVA